MNDPLNDTKSSIMPLQQILKMYCDNLNGVEANLNDRIYFEIIADDHYLSSSESKLHVIATYNWGITTEDGVSYKGLAADFAQLCPINCDNIGINYYRMMNVLGRIFKL